MTVEAFRVEHRVGGVASMREPPVRQTLFCNFLSVFLKAAELLGFWSGMGSSRRLGDIRIAFMDPESRFESGLNRHDFSEIALGNRPSAIPIPRICDRNRPDRLNGPKLIRRGARGTPYAWRI